MSQEPSELGGALAIWGRYGSYCRQTYHPAETPVPFGLVWACLPPGLPGSIILEAAPGYLIVRTFSSTVARAAFHDGSRLSRKSKLYERRSARRGEKKEHWNRYLLLSKKKTLCYGIV